MSTQLPSNIEKNFLLEKHLYFPQFSDEHPIAAKEEAERVASLLKIFLPSESLSSFQSFFSWMTTHLPLLTWRLHTPKQYHHMLYLICLSSPESPQATYFQERIKSTFFNGKDPSFFSIGSSRFSMDELKQEFLFVEVSFRVSDKYGLAYLEQYLPTFVREITLNPFFSRKTPYPLASPRHFFSPEIDKKQKISQIQKNLGWILEYFSETFDEDLLDRWQVFLSFAPSSFYELRSGRHLSRIVALQYLMWKDAKRALLTYSEKRTLQLRLLPTQLQSSFGKKSVYGVLITLSFLDKYEYFDEEHALLAIQKWMPDIRLVPGSRYLYRDPQEGKICALYIEIEREGGRLFSLNERHLILHILPSELKERIQKLVPLLFTVRNEEQIMKNIIILSRELIHVHSLPQMMITFEKQTETALIFNVILVHCPLPPPIEEHLYQTKPHIEVFLERRETIGYLEEGVPKEASLFRFHVAKSREILRKDFSVDVYLARQRVFEAIHEALGEVRDYDGGLITKQQELFSYFKDYFSDAAKENRELLENFFYSITPIENQATLSLEVLKTLFSLVLASQEEDVTKKGAYVLKWHETEEYLFIFIRAEHFSLRNHLQKEDILSSKILAKSTFSLRESFAAGYILETEGQSHRQQLLSILQNVLHKWQQERNASQVLRLNLTNPPLSLDPRKAGDEVSKNILQMLYEGLMCMGPSGNPELAVAESVTVSQDLKKYVFHLKKCLWSNGDPLTAFDFEHAWKQILLPDFKTPFSHFFYPIKNARAAKNRSCSLEEIGVKVLSKSTLQVELEHPVPYFLALVASPLFSPVHAVIDKENPHWPAAEGDAFVCNGPFHLKKAFEADGYILEKNNLYRDADRVHLKQVILTRSSIRKALEMFKNDELHWLGRPIHPWHSLFESAKVERAEKISMPGNTYWCSLNMHRFPFQNLKLRQALSLAIDRQEIVDILHDGTPAFSPLPPIQAQYPSYGRGEGEIELAKTLFEKALKELNLTSQTFPHLNMLHPETERRKKISQLIQHHWKKYLGIELHIQGLSWPSLFQKISEAQYEIACLSWSPWVNDPLYTLHAFKYADDDLNFPKWGNSEFQELLDLAAQEINTTRKKQYVARAEALLIKEMPVIPILYEKYKGLKKKYLKVDINPEAINFNTAILEH